MTKRLIHIRGGSRNFGEILGVGGGGEEGRAIAKFLAFWRRSFSIKKKWNLAENKGRTSLPLPSMHRLTEYCKNVD